MNNPKYYEIGQRPTEVTLAATIATYVDGALNQIATSQITGNITFSIRGFGAANFANFLVDIQYDQDGWWVNGTQFLISTYGSFVSAETIAAIAGSDAPKEEGLHVPVGLAIWASVSDDVHEKLTRQAKDRAGFRLAPGEWTGGGHLWLLALVGPEQTMPALRDKVIESVFENKLHSEHTLARIRSTKPASDGAEQDLGETKH